MSNGSGKTTRAVSPGRQQPVIQFGTFTLDLSTGELTRGGRTVPLQNQPARVLCLLVSSPGQLVTREELRRALWSNDTFVEFETALNIAVTKIRQAIGDSATSPRFVETLPRRGYRFIADVHPAARALPDPGATASSNAEARTAMVFVSDAGLANTIRRAIGQPENSAPIVRTVHGSGYAVAAASENDVPHYGSAHTVAEASCWLLCGRRQFPLPDGEHIVGRDPEAGIRLASPKVSRCHAKVVVHNSHAVLIDLGSKNGSFVRGLRVTEPTPLEPGDDIRIGPFALIFRIAEDAGSTESEVP